ncbi:hypothetical protein AAHE18_10G172600 [Arachis hypogaea]
MKIEECQSRQIIIIINDQDLHGDAQTTPFIKKDYLGTLVPTSNPYLDLNRIGLVRLMNSSIYHAPGAKYAPYPYSYSFSLAYAIRFGASGRVVNSNRTERVNRFEEVITVRPTESSHDNNAETEQGQE